MSEAVDLFTQQARNRRRSRWLIVAFVAFFAWLGLGGDLIVYLSTQDAPRTAYHHTFPFLSIILTVAGAGIAMYAWRTGTQKVLWSTGAWELITPDGDAQTQLVNVVEELAIASGIPRPRIYLVHDPDPNAFATGRDPATACVAVTDGLLAICSRDELQAVVAHEMGHIKNLDTRLMTLLASLVGAVALIHDGIGRTFRTTGRVPLGGVVGRGGRGKNSGPLLPILVAVWLLSWLLAPLVTRMLALAVSRKREFLADAMGAQFTRNPLALASALEKIEGADAPTAAIKQGCAHLCIADPLGRRSSLKQGFVADLLGTHPPMAIRIARLKAMAYQAQKQAGTFVAAADGPAPTGS